MSRQGRGGIRGSRQLLVGSRRRRVQLGTRSRRSLFNGVPYRAMEQVKGEGQAEAPGPLEDPTRPGRGWRGGAGAQSGLGVRSWARDRSNSEGAEGVRAAAGRWVSGGARPGRGERRVPSAPVTATLREEGSARDSSSAWSPARGGKGPRPRPRRPSVRCLRVKPGDGGRRGASEEARGDPRQGTRLLGGR